MKELRELATVNDAYEYFKNGEFENALEVYRILSKKINNKAFLAEIEICKRRISSCRAVKDNKKIVFNGYYLQNRKNILTNRTVKFSIIVVCYNQQEYIYRAINSCINQSYKNIEIICVDDHSSDKSASVLMDFAELDSRITVIVHDGNFSAHMCRKNGVLNSSGEYVLFLDGDDELELDLCENLVNMAHNSTDIIHFSTTIIPMDITQANVAKKLEQSLRPKIEQIGDKNNLLESFFIKNIAGFNLCNKCIRQAVAFSAFKELEDVYLARGNDTYALVAVAFYSKKYLGVSHIYGYKYYYGNGIYGNSTYTPDMYGRLLQLYTTYISISSLLKKISHGVDYEKISTHLYNSYWKDAGYRLLNFIKDKDKQSCFSMFANVYGVAESVSSIAINSWNNENKRLTFLNRYFSETNRKWNCVRNDNVKNIAIIYHRLNIGGVQRVIVETAKIFLAMGKNVTVIIFESNDIQLEVPEGVKIIIIDIPHNINAFPQRTRELHEAIASNNIDTVYYHMYSDNFIAYDLILFREMGVKVVLHIHSVFTVLFRNKVNMNLNVAVSVLKYADALITLSTIDKEFWSYFSDNVHFIQNPVTVHNPPKNPSSLNKKNILFVGRLDIGKRVNHALIAFSKIHQEVPDSKLIIVGDSNIRVIKEEIDDIIEQNKLKNSVVLAGFQCDVGKFFSEAAVLIITSAYEGYPLILAEAKIYGVPVVMYNLPTLELQRNGKGVVVVDQCDIDSLSNEVISLLKDYEYRKKVGYDGFTNGIELINNNLSIMWDGVFKSIHGKYKNYAKSNEMLQILLDDVTGILSSLRK